MAPDTTIGIVEDEILIAEDLSSLLEELGYTVGFHTTSGEDCLEVVETSPIDIIIMDVNLTGEMNGIETASALREHFDIPVIYLSAHPDDKTLQRAMETDPFGYLSKPIDQTELRTTLAIASRKIEMEDKIRSSERRYRELIETTPDIIFRVNTDREFTFLSQNVVQLGYEPDDLIGGEFTEILHPDTREKVIREEILPEGETKERGSDGSPGRFGAPGNGDRATQNQEIKIQVGTEAARQRYGTESPTFEVNSAGVYGRNGFNGESECIGSVGVIRNVMPRKETQKELRLKERAMSSAQEGITIAQADGENNPLIYVNDGFVEMTGYERKWALGRDCRFLQGEDTDPQKVDTMRRAIQQEEPVTVEIKNYRRDGESFWNKVSITPIRNEAGKVTHYVGIQQDISRQKEQEQQLRQAEKLAAIGEMSAGLMHEINNPNTFVQGNLQFLSKAWDTIRDELPESATNNDKIAPFLGEIKQTLSDMKRGAQRIEEIVNNVNQFSRRERNPDEYQYFDPVPVVRDTLTTLEVDDCDFVTVTLGENPSDSQIQGDPTELTQVVTNLVKNALDAIEDTTSPEVNVRTRFESDCFQLVVDDNGSGIAEEDRSKIFDPFFTTKPTGEGTGLGLSIVNGIVDRSGGTITVESDCGEGTRFTVVWPQVSSACEG